LAAIATSTPYLSAAAIGGAELAVARKISAQILDGNGRLGVIYRRWGQFAKIFSVLQYSIDSSGLRSNNACARAQA
jgi:hypothetical protein